MIRFELGAWVGLENLANEELNACRNTAERAVLKAALHIEGAIKKRLSGPRSGRVYRVPGTRRTYQASAPGEPPAVLFGKLRQSITHTMPYWVEDQVQADVGSDQPYSRILEYGGLAGNGARILPRPYMEPTFLAEEQALDVILSEATKT